MVIFLDESGDLGWSLDRPFKKGGSSRFITIAGIAIGKNCVKNLVRHVDDLYIKYKPESNSDVELKGCKFSNREAVSIVKGLHSLMPYLPFQTISITADKRNVHSQLRRDTNVFYNHMLNNLLAECLITHDEIELVLDDRTIRTGSRNSFEDCLKAKCWGELGLNTTISCRYEESHKNRCIWIADWLANFIWRHYENNMNDAYFECCSQNLHYHERKLFM